MDIDATKAMLQENKQRFLPQHYQGFDVRDLVGQTIRGAVLLDDDNPGKVLSLWCDSGEIFSVRVIALMERA